MTNPTAFISHASGDKDRFVRSFAERLRTDGVDAWYDEWELRPADSLVDRIFDEGLAKADVFLIVLSPEALASQWVGEELNAAVVRRIGGKCKVLPIVLDAVEVPESLKATVWQSIADVSSYDEEYGRILAVLFDRTLAPPIGPAPAYASENTLIDDLPQGSVAVLMALGEQVLDSEQEFIQGSKTLDIIRIRCGHSPEQFLKELTRLSRADYVEVTVRGQTVSHGKLLLKGLIAYLQATGFDVDSAYISVVSELVNTDNRKLPELAAGTGHPAIVVDALLRLLEMQDLITVGRYLGGRDLTVVHRTDVLLSDELV